MQAARLIVLGVGLAGASGMQSADHIPLRTTQDYLIAIATAAGNPAIYALYVTTPPLAR